MVCIIQSLIDSITRIRDAAKIGLATMEHFARLEGAMARGVEYVGTGEPGSQALFFCQALFAYKLKRVW